MMIITLMRFIKEVVEDAPGQTTSMSNDVSHDEE